MNEMSDETNEPSELVPMRGPFTREESDEAISNAVNALRDLADVRKVERMGLEITLRGRSGWFVHLDRRDLKWIRAAVLVRSPARERFVCS